MVWSNNIFIKLPSMSDPAILPGSIRMPDGEADNSPVSVFDDKLKTNANLQNTSTDNKALSDSKYSQNTANGCDAAFVSTIPKNKIPYLEIKKITDLNTGIYKDKVVQMSDGKYYEFDSQGRVSRIYNEPKNLSVNGTENSYTLIEYNDDNTVAKYWKYENEGKIIDGQRYCGIYNKNGELESYCLESDFDPVSGDVGRCEKYDIQGNLTDKTVKTYDADGRQIRYESKEYYPDVVSDVKLLHNNMDTMTSDVLSDILNQIEELEISDINLNDEQKNKILFVMDMYEVQYGQSLLEALAETPNGKELTQTLINHVKFLCEPGEANDATGIVYKYTDDIQSDMASHPTDYKKLSIDLKRMLNRPWLSESENKNGEYGDNVVDINGKIDLQQNVKQNKVGDCYLIASIIELSQKPEGARAIDEMIHENEGSVTVTFKGVNKSYTISQQELIDSDNFSVGDDDMRAIEIAFDKYRRDLAYESGDYMSVHDSAGGFLTDVTQAIFGQSAEYIKDGNFDINDFNNENTAYTFDFNIDGKYNDAGISVKNAAGEVVQDKMIQNHEYAIVKSDENNVYFINPWDKNDLLSMSIDEFKNIQGLNVSRFKLTTDDL